jgi:hypothetical protein
MIRHLMILALLCVVGCSSEKPVTAPKLDPAAAAELAMQEYDSDSDGKISKAEAKKTAMDPKKGWDSDGDGAISADEVQARLERYEALKAGIQTLTCTVRFRGDFLPDAAILFDPEPFLGETAVMAEGTTDGYGQAEITAPSISEQDPTLQGIRCGLMFTLATIMIMVPTTKMPQIITTIAITTVSLTRTTLDRKKSTIQIAQRTIVTRSL